MIFSIYKQNFSASNSSAFTQPMPSATSNSVSQPTKKELDDICRTTLWLMVEWAKGLGKFI